MVCATPECEAETRTMIHVDGEDVPICPHCLYIAQLAATLAAQIVNGALEE